MTTNAATIATGDPVSSAPAPAAIANSPPGGTLARARELRRTIYEVFRPLADEREPDREALAALAAFHADAVAGARPKMRRYRARAAR